MERSGTVAAARITTLPSGACQILLKVLASEKLFFGTNLSAADRVPSMTRGIQRESLGSPQTSNPNSSFISKPQLFGFTGNPVEAKNKKN